MLFAGFMASLPGAFLSIGDIHTFTEGMTRGAGYLAIASVIFGKWKIGGTVIACLLFGAATALQFQLPALGIAVPNALLCSPIFSPCWRSEGWSVAKWRRQLWPNRIVADQTGPNVSVPPRSEHSTSNITRIRSGTHSAPIGVCAGPTRLAVDFG